MVSHKALVRFRPWLDLKFIPIDDKSSTAFERNEASFFAILIKHLKYVCFSGIIAKEPTSLEEELKEIRRVGSSRDLSGSSSSPEGSSPNSSEFAVSDTFYFCRRGIESIVDDEVTKRFSAEELESWNLLTRSNNNFRHISTRLTALWGLGLIIRYCILLPLR